MMNYWTMRTAKRVLSEGVLSILAAALFLTLVIANVSEYDLSFRHYVVAYCLSALASVVLATILLLIVTCIESFLIMTIDKRFVMQNLLISNLSYFGKNILLSACFILMHFYVESKVVVTLAMVVAFGIAAFLMVDYYMNLVRVARVHKKAANLLVAILSVLAILSNALVRL